MLALAIAITTGVITPIMMAADGIRGPAAGRVGLCRAVSISPIVTVRGTGTHKKDKRWAYGTIGTLVGFWLRQ